ncbi:MAG: ABC transporter permease [Firmicutes bacterium]|jgi:osmoprotectant transport system permease protein|nr:ABC transporter permease [Bacillota bacterium]
MQVLQKSLDYIAENPAQFIGTIQEHLFLVLVPVAMAIVVAVPLGILATRYHWLEKIAVSITNIVQTIPSLAMLAIMIIVGLGLGNKPAMTALFFYSLLPILRNTLIGIKNVDSFLKEAATGMGMTNLQLLLMVELPLALSVIMAGIRTATVICIGTATLAVYIGAGGVGTYIVRGLQLMQNHLLLLGVVPAAVMALLADYLLGKIEYLLIPRGLRAENK